MSRRGEEETLRVHIELYKADWDWLVKRFGSPSPRIRQMVRQFVTVLRAKDVQQVDQMARQREEEGLTDAK